MRLCVCERVRVQLSDNVRETLCDRLLLVESNFSNFLIMELNGAKIRRECSVSCLSSKSKDKNMCTGGETGARAIKKKSTYVKRYGVRGGGKGHEYTERGEARL